MLPCCASAKILGRVTGPNRRSLRDIWQGHAAEATRAAIDVGDFRQGCDECASADPETSMARSYDHLVPHRPVLEHPQLIDFALSNRCNLACTMCNGDLSSTIRSEVEHRPPLPNAYDDRFFAELREFLPHLTHAVFKGGEPFLAPEVLTVWSDLAELGRACSVAVTTNGTVVTDRRLELVDRLRMDVTVSIDAMDPATYSSIRAGADLDAVLRNVDRLQEVVEGNGSTLTLCYCLMADNVGELGPVLAEATRRGAEVSVIWVGEPRRSSLLAQGRAAVAEALTRLEHEADRWTGVLGPNQVHWDATIDRLRRHLAEQPPGGPEGPVAVPISIATAADDAADPLATHLAGAPGARPIRARAVDGVWVEVDAPEWSSWLAPDRWRDESVANTLALIWEHAGAEASFEVEDLDHQTRRIALHLASADGAVDLDALLHEGRDGQTFLAISPTEPAPP